MNEFDCIRCGMHVFLIVEAIPEDRYCLQCRFIESLDTEEDKRKIEEFLKTKEG